MNAARNAYIFYNNYLVKLSRANFPRPLLVQLGLQAEGHRYVRVSGGRPADRSWNKISHSCDSGHR